MKQHLIRGRGQPTSAPTEYSQIYLDLETQEHWISAGVFTVDDWKGPYITHEALSIALTNLINGVSDSESGSVVELEVTASQDLPRHVEPKLNNRIGRFFMVTDPANHKLPFDFRVIPETALDLGSQFSVYNGTQGDMVFYSPEDTFLYVDSPDAPLTFPPGSKATIKMVGATMNSRKWLVWR